MDQVPKSLRKAMSIWVARSFDETVEASALKLSLNSCQWIYELVAQDLE